MKKNVLIIGLCALMLTLAACSPTPTATLGETSASVPTSAPTAAPTAEPTTIVSEAPTATPTATPSATPIPEEEKNKLVLLNPRTFTGAEYLPATNREDGTYLYRTRLNDGQIMIVNQSRANIDIQDEFTTDEQYIYYYAENLAFGSGQDLQVVEDDAFTKKFGLITYRVSFKAFVNEQNRTFTGLIFKNDRYTFSFTCDTSSEKFEEVKDLFEEILDGLDLMEIE